MSLWLALIVGCSIGALFAWHRIVGRWIWPKQWVAVLNQSMVAWRLWILWGVVVLVLGAISQNGHGGYAMPKKELYAKASSFYEDIADNAPEEG